MVDVTGKNYGNGGPEGPLKINPAAGFKQMFIYTDTPFGTAVTVAGKLFGGEETSLPAKNEFWSKYVLISVFELRNKFRGLNGISYVPPFGTEILVEALTKTSEEADYQSELERCVNGLLAQLPERCVVLNLERELYRKGF